MYYIAKKNLVSSVCLVAFAGAVNANAQANQFEYTVLNTDTLYSISKATCSSVTQLIDINNLSDFNAIQPGMTLSLPSGHCYSLPDNNTNVVRRFVEPVSTETTETQAEYEQGKQSPNSRKIGDTSTVFSQDKEIDKGYAIYVVESGITTYGISKLTCLSLDDIKNANNMSDWTLEIGQELKIPLISGHCFKPKKIENTVAKQKSDREIRMAALTPRDGFPVGSLGDRVKGVDVAGNYTGSGTVYFMPFSTSVAPETYKGQLKNGRANGLGVYTTGEGVRLSGQWNGGVLDFDTSNCETNGGSQCAGGVMFIVPQYHLFDLAKKQGESIRIDSIRYDFSEYDERKRKEEIRANPPKEKEVHIEAPSGFAAFLANKDVQKALIDGGNAYYQGEAEAARTRQKIANDSIQRQRERDLQIERNRQQQIRQAERARRQRESTQEIAPSSTRTQQITDTGYVETTRNPDISYQGRNSAESSSNSKNVSVANDKGCYKISRICISVDIEKVGNKTSLWVTNDCSTRMYRRTCLYDRSDKDFCEAGWLPANSKKLHYSYNEEITSKYKVDVVGSNKGANDWVCSTNDELVETFRY